MPKLPPKMAQKVVSSRPPSGEILNIRTRLEEAEALMKRGQSSSAHTICEELVARNPSYTGALDLLGNIHFVKGDYPRALSFLVRTAMLNPVNLGTLKLLGATYVRLGAWEMAAQTFEQALLIKPDDAGALIAHSEILRREQEYESAADGYRKVLKSDPLSQAAETGLGMCCKNTGHIHEAMQCFERLLKRGGRSMQLILSAVQLPAPLTDMNWLDLVGEIPKDDNEERSEFENAVAFLKAAILDRTGRHTEAWQQLVIANQYQFLTMQETWHRQSQYQETTLARARDSATKMMGGVPGEGRSAVSLFILGASRSGKTTLEALVNSLDHVKRGYESPIVENAVRHAYQSAGYLASRQYAGMPAKVESLCREFYLDELQRRAGTARVFTNTDPDRIHEAAKLAEIIPNVRFAFVKRDPDDLALRIFMKNYSAGNFHAYDLTAIRQYIAWYYEIIDILAAKFPEISRVIHYEEMIANPVETRAVIAQLCGLNSTETPLPSLGDDRNCAAPYLSLMNP